MTLPPPLHSIATAIDEALEAQPETSRGHLGPSLAGNPCDRALWIGFRWAVIPRTPARIRRLFRRGQLEESTAAADLIAAGVVLTEYGAKQRRIRFAGHVYGSPDGIILSGLPEAPSTRHVWENKTHNRKSFDALERDGVAKSKPEHVVQMQCYMKGTECTRALYMATCKDDDRRYYERVEFDAEVADKALARLERITLDERMPAPLSTDQTWYQCRFCACHEFCFETKKTREMNCRTCAHATPEKDGRWTCAVWDGAAITEEYQREGCRSHVPHPDLVPWALNQEKSTKRSGYFEGVGLVGEEGLDSREVLK